MQTPLKPQWSFPCFRNWFNDTIGLESLITLSASNSASKSVRCISIWFSRSICVSVSWSKCWELIGYGNGKFVDTFLKLTTKMPLMYTENHDVSNGIANGTLCFLSKVVLHTNVMESDFSLTNVDSYYIRTIDASKVDYLLCQIDGSNRMFKVKADHVSCKINFPIQLIPGQKIRKIVRASVNRFPVRRIMPQLDTSYKDKWRKAYS